MNVYFKLFLFRYAAAKTERDIALDELEQVRIREERERERSLTMHAAAVSDLKSRLGMQTEAQRRMCCHHDSSLSLYLSIYIQSLSMY